MKLFRFGEHGIEKPGALWNNKKLDASSFGEDFGEDFFKMDGLNRFKKWIEVNHDKLPVIPEAIRFGSCVQRPSKIVCIGLNYSDHAKESNMELPKEPILFFKSTT